MEKKEEPQGTNANYHWFGTDSGKCNEWLKAVALRKCAREVPQRERDNEDIVDFIFK